MSELVLDSTADADGSLVELASVVRSALSGEIPDDRSAPDRAQWRRCGELGWLSLLVPELRGGAGGDERAAAVVARGMGRACRHEPYVAAVMAVRCLVELPATPRLDSLLDRLATGASLNVLAWQCESGDGGGLPERLPVRASADGGDLVLSGTVHWVPTAHADAYLVAAEYDGTAVLAEVDPRTEGVRIVPTDAADGTTWARLELHGVRVTALATGEQVPTALRTAIHTGTVLCAAELLGLVDRMVELTVDYLSTRRQFGRPIGSFQALRHRAVDMWVQQRLSDAALNGALRRVCAPDADVRVRALAASSAKARTSAAALRVANEAVQLHGAIGFTDEYQLGRYVNRALALGSWLGNARSHAHRYDRLVAS